MDVDLLIQNGVMVIPKDGLFKGCLGIVGEKIVGMYDSPRGISARTRIDARGNYILPGLVEPHVHYGYKGNVEGHFRTETASAALGGITTVIPHPLLPGLPKSHKPLRRYSMDKERRGKELLY
jgi:dihydropyrimidinase